MWSYIESMVCWVAGVIGICVCIYFITSCQKAKAQEITPIGCPVAGGWQFKGPMVFFESLCDNVEWTDEGIIVPTACPFRSKIEGQELHKWLSTPCRVILKFYKEEDLL